MKAWDRSLTEEAIGLCWLLVAVLAWIAGIKWLAWVAGGKAAMDFLCSFHAAWKDRER